MLVLKRHHTNQNTIRTGNGGAENAGVEKAGVENAGAITDGKP